jgi:hypothetical protein
LDQECLGVHRAYGGAGGEAITGHTDLLCAQSPENGHALRHQDHSALTTLPMARAALQQGYFVTSCHKTPHQRPAPISPSGRRGLRSRLREHLRIDRLGVLPGAPLVPAGVKAHGQPLLRRGSCRMSVGRQDIILTSARVPTSQADAQICKNATNVCGLTLVISARCGRQSLTTRGCLGPSTGCRSTAMSKQHAMSDRQLQQREMGPSRCWKTSVALSPPRIAQHTLQTE